jgi:hypothetical protein
VGTRQVSTGLPDLVVIGAPKAGTTSLARWLAAHPQMRMSATKELEFLDRFYDRGLDWYRAQLPPPGPYLIGEATPTYLGDERAPERAGTTLPGARYVAVLREPVARAWSNYWFFCELGVERRSWSGALRAERAGRSPAGYLSRGRYAEQLARWDAAVGADRVLVVLFDDLVADPAGVHAQVCRFAGISDDVALPSTDAVNPTSRPRSRRLQYALHRSGISHRPWGRRVWTWNAHGGPPPRLDPQQAAALRGGFADANARLAERLGRPLPPSWSA